MPKYPDLSKALQRWWKEQNHWRTYKDLSKDLEIPIGTLKKYFYGQKWPRSQNQEKLYLVSNLSILAERRPAPIQPPSQKVIIDQFSQKKLIYASQLMERLCEELARTMTGLPPAIEALDLIKSNKKQTWMTMARVVQLTMDALERSLRPFLDSEEALEVLRKEVNGADAGYLSGLLSALFDDRRLATWKEMTTYQYGGQKHGR